jgi:hypothetical protein
LGRHKRCMALGPKAPAPWIQNTYTPALCRCGSEAVMCGKACCCRCLSPRTARRRTGTR